MSCLIFSCSNKITTSKISFVVGNQTSSINLTGGVIVYGINSESEDIEQFSLPSTNLSELGTKEIELAIGNWSFYAFGWEPENSNQANYEGVMYCASSELKIDQKVESVNLTLGLDCTHNGIAGGHISF